MAIIKQKSKSVLDSDTNNSSTKYNKIPQTPKKGVAKPLGFVITALVAGGVGVLGGYLATSHGLLSPSLKLEGTFLSDTATLVKSEKQGAYSAHILQNKDNAADKIAVFTGIDGNIIMGNILDKEGKPIFNDFIEKNIAEEVPVGEATEQSAQTAGAISNEKGQMLGEYKGELPELIKFVDGLSGYKEDSSVGPESTLYVVYDPRCPYCHQFFDTTRTLKLKEKGITIKWLPTLALGEARVGTKDAELATAGLTLQSGKDAKSFADTFNNIAPNITVTQENHTRLEENLQFLLDSARALGVSAVVPTAFYLDKKSGLPRLMSSPGDAENLKLLFGE